jgi:exopolysaccharide biosynthesis protein
MVGTNGGTMCFLVGGWQTRATAVSIMSTFGCTARLQLDGGYSSQMAHWDGGKVIDISGYFPIWDRPVPHVIVFFQ